ncbi:hypothetical protein Ddc_14827 [Ditylenchus destructor]|nr:hypothetical protein Ddc_14827 [Ditylenchus destructor]
MWYELLRFFSRKELVQLHFANRFFGKAIQTLKLPALHIINKLKIKGMKQGALDINYCVVTEEDDSGNILGETHFAGKNFQPPNYVRFAKVILYTLVINDDLMQCLKQHKVVFTKCLFGFFSEYIHEETAIDTIKVLMDDVFTDCRGITIIPHEWNSIKQLKICSLAGVNECNSVRFVCKMPLTIEDPFYESIFEWLHANKETKRKLVLNGFRGCEPTLRQLMTKFPNDVEPHPYVLYVTDVDDSFLSEFDNFSAKNSTTGEEMVSLLFINDENDLIFCLTRAFAD